MIKPRPQLLKKHTGFKVNGKYMYEIEIAINIFFKLSNSQKKA